MDANIYVFPLPDIDCRSLLDRALPSGGFPLHGTSTALNSGPVLPSTPAHKHALASPMHRSAHLQQWHRNPHSFQRHIRVPPVCTAEYKPVHEFHIEASMPCSHSIVNLHRHTVPHLGDSSAGKPQHVRTVLGDSYAYDRTTKWQRESVGCGSLAFHCNKHFNFAIGH